jgi:hypothetical protein
MKTALVPIQLAAMICALVFVASFFTAFFALCLAGARSGALANLPEEQGLSWGERAGRMNSRGNRIFFADEFRSERRVASGAAVVMIASAGSFGLLLLLLRILARWG